MPGDLELSQAVKKYVETEVLFGLEDFSQGPRHPDPPSEPTAAASPEKERRLADLYAKYAKCMNCPLGATRNKIVFGMGALDPKVLFIGEGPGYEEDRKGLPFVGRAGELLDKMMAAIGLSRETVYIANMVKCHPMKNPGRPDLRGNDRPPEAAEMEACRNILTEQIAILDPPVICALGTTAVKALLRTAEGITRLRGKVFDFEVPGGGKAIPLLPTYHPAALLRNPELKRDAWEDLKRLRGLIVNRE